MGKVKTIDVTKLTGDVTIKASVKNNTLYLKGLSNITGATVVGSDTKNDLTITVNGHNITLKDYFAKNGKFPIKTLKIDNASYNLVNFVNDHGIKGAAQNKMATMIKKFNGSVFDDIIMSGTVTQTINALGGNDTIYAASNNATLIGGTGTNTFNYKYDNWDDTSFGKDTIKLTKGETLYLYVGYDSDGRYIGSDATPIPLTYSRGTGKNANDLIITNEKNANDKITIQNYYGKDTGATVYINGTNLAESTVGLLAFNEGHVYKNKITSSALADVIDASLVEQQYKTIKNKKGKKVSVPTSLVINSGAGNDTITGSAYNDVITAGKGTNTVNFVADNTLGTFGNDIIKLTKGEVLNIYLYDTDGTTPLAPSYSKSGKSDLLVTTDKGTVTIKNYYSKNTKATVRINDVNLAETPSIMFSEDSISKKGVLTTSALADNIDISGLTDPIKTKKGVKYGASINSGSGNDLITGSDFVDTIKGGAGDDTIKGGLGNDKLYGEKGNNTFVFSAGDGKDIVYGGKGTDTISLVNFLPKDITFTKKGNDLILNYNFVEQDETLVARDSVTIKNYYKGKKVVSSVKYLETENGKVLIETAMKYKKLYPDLNLISKSGDITGSIYNDVVLASDEADTITAGKGEDLIIGAVANDAIVFHNGDGDDVVEIDAQHIPGTLIFADLPHLTFGTTISGEVVGDDVVLHYNKVGEFQNKVTLKNFMKYEDSYNIKVSTGDSTFKPISDIVINEINNYTDEKATVYGTKFKDNISTKEGLRETIYAGDGNDSINDRSGVNGDETGGDIIYGGVGNDGIYYEHATDSTYIDGGTGDDEIRIFTGTAIGGLGEDEIRIGGSATVYGDLTLEDDPTQAQGHADFIVGSSANQIIYGGGGADNIVGNGGSDVIYGGAGDDTIYTGSNTGAGDSTADVETLVHGGAGDDTIYGQAVKNVMYGDEGNDTINGWSGGEDIFVVKKGDGTDTIFGGEAGDTVDTIKFDDETISLDDLTPSFDGNDLIISYNGTDANDKIIIKDYVSDGVINSSIDTLKFYDGTTKSIKTDLKYTIYANSATTTGTVLSDIIVASDEFSNTIYGGLGNDTVVSGIQNDTIYGGAGANIYEFNNNSGTDTVYTTSGLDTVKSAVASMAGITTTIVNDDIEITNNVNSDKVILKDYMNNMVDVTIKDNSGNTMSLYDKAGMVLGNGEIEGDGNANRLIGGAGADTLTGHRGNDILNGRGGSDTYVFRKGDGKDIVINGTDGVVDYLYFADSTKDELTYDISGDDLVIYYNGGEDSVKVKNYFVEGNTVKKLKDSTYPTTETVFDIAEINRYTVTFDPEAPGFANAVNGTPLNDSITFSGDYAVTGGAGNDTITINGGTNTVEAGKGNDIINMGTGSTTLIFRNGDGHDTINMNALATTDSYLQFMDCEAHQLKYELSGDDMILSYNYDNGTKTYKDSVTIKDWATYYNPASEPATIPVLNKIKNSYGTSDSQANILYRFSNTINNYYTELDIITGTKFNDNISTKEGLRETIFGGYGDDIINDRSGVNGDENGGDSIYGGAGNDSIYYEHATDNTFIDGGVGNDKIQICLGIAIGGLGEDEIRRYGWTGTTTIYGDLTLQHDAEQIQGDYDKIFIGNDGTKEIIYAGGGNDDVCGRGGEDIIYGGAGNDRIWAYQGYSVTNVYKDSTAGWNSEIHGGAGDDHLFAQVETNNLYGDGGDDNFYAYIDQKTTVSDSEGTDILNMFDTQTDDAAKSNLHILFNVTAGYDYDSEDANTLFNGNVFVTGTATKANYDLWTSNGAFVGVSVVGNTVETIKSSNNWTLSKENISLLAESVAGWLTANGYADVNGVFSNALGKADNNSTDIETLIAQFDNASWSAPAPLN